MKVQPATTASLPVSSPMRSTGPARPSPQFSGVREWGNEFMEYNDFRGGKSPAGIIFQELTDKWKQFCRNRFKGCFKPASASTSQAESIESPALNTKALHEDLYKAMGESPESVYQVWKTCPSDETFEAAMLSSLVEHGKSFSNRKAIQILERFNTAHRGGKNVFHAAARSNNKEAVEIAKRLDLNPKAPDDNGVKPADLATEPEMKALLQS